MREDHLRLVELDLGHLWHPFTQEKLWIADADPLVISAAEGMELVDDEGRRYLDGVSSLWCNVHGHGVPELLRAIQEQSEKLCHSTLLGITHQPILELVRGLLPVLPDNLTRLFFSDSGSAAVEAALRMSIEWWHKSSSAAGRKKNRFISLEGSYHGDTLGSVGVGFAPEFHAPLRASIMPAIKAPPPHLFRFFEGSSETEALEQSVQTLERLLEQHADETAAVIIEPLVQGAAGIWVQPPQFMKEVSRLCRAHDVFLIADEVATGFGKTGRMFASQTAEVEPDLLVMGKGLTGGLLPMSAVAASEQIFSGFLGEPEEFKAFFYGQTFAGNPLAAAAASANLKLLAGEDFFVELQRRIEFFHSSLDRRILPLEHVDEIRRFGVMAGIELTKTKNKHDPYQTRELAGPRIVKEARKRGAVIRGLGNVMVLMPPLAMKEEQLLRLVEITAAAISNALD